MIKVKHEFCYKPPSLFQPFHHSISFIIRWNGQRYGHYEMLTEQQFEDTIYRTMKCLVLMKHRIVEDLKERDETI